MSVQGFEVKVVAGATGSGRSLRLREMMGGGPVIDLSGLALAKGSDLGLDDLSLPEGSDICIDQATALSGKALESLLSICHDQGRNLVLGTQELSVTVQACASALAHLGVSREIQQTVL